MAKKSQKTKAAPAVISPIVKLQQINRTKQDIRKWRNAITSAESVTNPNRRLLYELYTDLLVDGMLSSSLGKRTRNITNAPIMFVNNKGEQVEELTKLINTEYFTQMLKQIIATVWWGYTLLELEWPYFGQPLNTGTTHLVDRRYVKPELGIVVANPSDTTGVDYTSPDMSRFSIHCGQVNDLGLLLGTAQYVLYKRGGFGDAAQFVELFGMPFRHATYNNPESKAILEAALAKAGAAPYMVTPQGTEVEHVQSNAAGSSQLHKTFKAMCDEEILVSILGNTMTTKAESGSGYAQSRTHEAGEASVFDDDREYVMRVLNAQLIPVLQNLGYPVEGGAFKYKSPKLTLESVLKIKQSGTPIDDDYFYDTYGLPKPKDYNTRKDGTQEPPKDTNKAQGPNAPADKLSAQEHTFWQRFVRFMGLSTPDTLQLADSLTSALESFLRAIHDATIAPNTVHQPLFFATAQQLWGAVESGYGTPTIQYQGFDNTMLRKLRENIYAFSAAKNLEQFKQLNELRFDANGKLRTWAQFRNATNKVVAEFNETHLRTEMDTADASAQMAAKWGDIEEQAEVFPFLQYRTAGDEKVRKTHVKLNGFTARVNDPVWDKIYPPNGYNCRCSVIQVATNTSKVKLTKEDIDNATDADLFEQNVGRSGKVFSDQHPYFANTSTYLTATRNYGMRPIAAPYAGKRADKLPQAIQGQYTGTTRDIFNTELQGSSSHPQAASIPDAVKLPDEVWARNDQFTYIKYYRDAPLAITTDFQGSILNVQALALDDESLRSGTLMHRA